MKTGKWISPQHENCPQLQDDSTINIWDSAEEIKSLMKQDEGTPLPHFLKHQSGILRRKKKDRSLNINRHIRKDDYAYGKEDDDDNRKIKGFTFKDNENINRPRLKIRRNPYERRPKKDKGKEEIVADGLTISSSHSRMQYRKGPTSNSYRKRGLSQTTALTHVHLYASTARSMSSRASDSATRKTKSSERT